MIRPTSVLLLVAVSGFAAEPVARVQDGKIVVASVPSVAGLKVVIAEGKPEDIASRAAVAGEWTLSGGSAVFTPTFPLRPGTTHRVFLSEGKSVDVRMAEVTPARAATLIGVHPSGDTVPENILRFYVHFDAPMPRGDVYKYVRILRADGKAVEQPFLELDDELWNEDQTRLTLFIDPGRIKREVKPLIDLGPVFAAGDKYSLVVSGQWPTLTGKPLGRETTRTLSATSRIESGIDPKKWKLSVVGDGPLTIEFDRPMDHAMTLRGLTVIGPDDRPVSGKTALGPAERSWTFVPKKAWGAGKYRVRVAADVEDVCANAIGRPFEGAMGKLTRAPKVADVELPFAIMGR